MGLLDHLGDESRLVAPTVTFAAPAVTRSKAFGVAPAAQVTLHGAGSPSLPRRGSRIPRQPARARNADQCRTLRGPPQAACERRIGRRTHRRHCRLRLPGRLAQGHIATRADSATPATNEDRPESFARPALLIQVDALWVRAHAVAVAAEAPWRSCQFDMALNGGDRPHRDRDPARAALRHGGVLSGVRGGAFRQRGRGRTAAVDNRGRRRCRRGRAGIGATAELRSAGCRVTAARSRVSKVLPVEPGQAPGSMVCTRDSTGPERGARWRRAIGRRADLAARLGGRQADTGMRVLRAASCSVSRPRAWRRRLDGAGLGRLTATPATVVRRRGIFPDAS